MTHRLFNHNRHGKLESLLHDVHAQTGKLHSALAAGNTAPSVDNSQLISELQHILDVDIATIVKDIGDVINALRGAQQPAPTPAPQPAPAPTGQSSGITWPSFAGTDALVGVSKTNVSVYVDANLGAESQKNATDLLADADRIVGINNTLFGLRGPPAPVRVILFEMGATDGTGGADHLGCDWRTGGDIEVCVDYGNSARCSALFEAELCECAMQGQLCGLSTGEALSRWCAMVVSDNALSDFATGPSWQEAGLENFVDATDPSDQNADSIGCGMVFISYLLHRGATLPQIAQAMVKFGDSCTFADLYGALRMGPANIAWPTFMGAVKELGTITSDDPFGQVNMAMKAHEHI